MDEPTEAINLITAYSDVRDCRGTMHLKVCKLQSAIGEYDVIVNNDLISFPSTASPQIVAIANNTPNHAWTNMNQTVHPSTLTGINDFAYGLMSSIVAFESPHGQIKSNSFGIEAHKYSIRTSDPDCPSFRDPYSNVMERLNSLMIYTGALAAVHNASYARSHLDPGWDINTTTLGYLQGSHSVYQTSYGYFWAAALIVVITLGLIAPGYWGYWRYESALNTYSNGSPLTYTI